MSKKHMLTLALLLVLLGLWSLQFDLLKLRASEEFRVYNLDSGLYYATIQAAINSAKTKDGDTIFIAEGVYYECVIVNKSIQLEGEDWSKTIIDGKNSGNGIFITVSDVAIRELTVRNCFTGIIAENSSDLFIARINASYNSNGIFIRYSHNLTVLQCIAGKNVHRGIFITNSDNFTITGNHAYLSGWYGLNTNSSTNGVISFNNVYKNYFDGIGLGLNSKNCIVFGNNIVNNTIHGIWVDTGSENNSIYRNNIVNNGNQAISDLPNSWDNGFEGNYWSDYVGIDNNTDGIGDTAYTIDANNIDRKPLVGTFSSFEVSVSHRVNIISNSSVSNLVYFKNPTNSTIKMYVSNKTTNQKYGFCRLCLSYDLMNEPYNVTVDGASPAYWNYTLFDDGENRWLYFSYNHSSREVTIEGTTPIDLVPPKIFVKSPRNRIYPINTIRLTFSVNEKVSWIGYSIDNKANETISGNVVLANMQDGAHTLIIYAIDIAGNEGSSDIIYFKVDTTAPEIIIFSPENKTYSADSVPLSFVVNEPTERISCKLDENETILLTGNITLTQLSEGSHHVTIYAEDLSGWTGVSETIYFTIDTQQQGAKQEPFPMWEIAAVITITIVTLLTITYFAKFKKHAAKKQ